MKRTLRNIIANLEEVDVGINRESRLVKNLGEDSQIIRQYDKRLNNYYTVLIRRPMERLIYPTHQNIIDIGGNMIEDLFDYLDNNQLSIGQRVEAEYIEDLVNNPNEIYGTINGVQITNLECMHYVNAVLLSEDVRYNYAQGRKMFIDKFHLNNGIN